ncbi:383_t:CDS:2 [Paraglomus brasilianum]|uniref:383_t:CDS:1 n=1 Tax=Paraglomus brasilianum TaxID=144538 RepID=A0A9N9FPM5_9GLOM|nr:383_t:CDS:2 [Paraglomus brasilianum]
MSINKLGKQEHLESELMEIKKQKEELEVKLTESETDIQELQNKDFQKSQDLENQQEAIKQLQSKITLLESQKNSYQEKFNNSLQFIKEVRKSLAQGKSGAKWAARGVGTVKDYFAGGGDGLGDFALNVDNQIKDGLNKCKEDIEAQGKALRGEMQGIKSELEGALKQQGEKFDEEIRKQDAKIAALSGEQKRQAEETKRALQKQKQQLEQAINEVEEKLMQAHNKLEKELDEFKNQVNERFEECEKKILENKRRIEEERIKREEEIREVKDKIKFTNTNLENLRKEKEELADEQLRFKNQIDQKTVQTQQSFEDLEAEYQCKTKILEAQIEDNQETIEEFNEQLNNFQREQAFQREQQEEL